MKYLIIDPAKKTAEVKDLETFADAKRAAGLPDLQTDIGLVAGWDNGGLSICVHELGLLEPPGTVQYFSLCGKLFAGSAVLYAHDDEGDTVDVPDGAVHPTWFDSVEDVEALIAKGAVRRPHLAVNGVVSWEWNKGGGRA